MVGVQVFLLMVVLAVGFVEGYDGAFEQRKIAAAEVRDGHSLSGSLNSRMWALNTIQINLNSHQYCSLHWKN